MLKFQIPPTNRKEGELDPELITKIIEDQIEEYPKIPITMDMVQNPEVLSAMKQLWLEDISYEKFGVEQEDYCQVNDI